MANVSVYNMLGQEVGKIDLNDAVFGAPVNENLLHMAVVQQLVVRAHRRLRHALRFPEAEESPGDRRAQATQDRDLQELPSGHTAA